MPPKALNSDYRMSRGLTPKVPLKELQVRYRRLQQSCRETGYDAVLVYGSPIEPSWMRYFANYVHPLAIGDSFLLAAPGRRPILLVDQEWYLANAREMSWVDNVRAYPYVEVVDNEGLTIAVVSYDDRLHFGITSDRDVIPDLDDLADAIASNFASLADAVAG